MKFTAVIAGLSVVFAAALSAAEEFRDPSVEKHREGSEALADEQDELAADVQQIILEQTAPKVIELLREVERIMDEATDRLAEADTGGETLAAQTEILEKIHAAAKERQSQGGGSSSGGAMMDMMERMMGKEPGDKDKNGNKSGDKPGEQAGGGANGESDAESGPMAGDGGGKSEVRRIPKASGGAGQEIPSEFRKAFDAYNRGAEELVK